MKWQIKFSTGNTEHGVIKYKRNVNGAKQLKQSFLDIFEDNIEDDVLEIHITRR